ncbi:MAG TPA: hypothetical protein VLH86_05960 [Patescibacteria group bacterium]|nr:hypothetical protein [Patescibacteria group bacterium]
MAEKRSIPRLLWKYKKTTALGAALLGGWIAFHGGDATPHTGANTAPVVMPSRETGGEWANRDPHSKHLACALLLKKAGVNFSLQTYITEGTPPAGAKVTYTARYLAGLSHMFANHNATPESIPWQQDAVIPGSDQGQALASVHGSIGNTECLPAPAGGH